MDTIILDVVIGLVLSYLVLALLVTKVQEYLVGQIGTSRQHTMHDMLEQALQGDNDLKEELLRNPLIFSLFKGNSIKKGLLRARGPSAIPSDLFARALLIEVHNDGKGSHPKDEYASPRIFVDNLGDKQNAHSIVGVLRGLLGGLEKDWPAYETAIANWFDQVGARADGWFQRKAAQWSLGTALVMAAVLNVNTFQLAERLSGDPDLRRNVVTLAKRTLEEFGDTKTSEATAPLAAPLDPGKRAENALRQAHERIVAVYFKNPKLASFDPNRQSLQIGKDQQALIQSCASAPPSIGENTRKSPLSNPATWLELLPTLRAEAGELMLPDLFTAVPNQAASCTSAPAAASAIAPVASNASAASVASTVAPVSCVSSSSPQISDVVPKAHMAATEPRGVRLRSLHTCMNRLSSWVTTSFGAASADASLRDELKDAERALVEAKDAVGELIGESGSSLLIDKLFLRDPEAFVGCADLSGMTRERMRACVESATAGNLSLPVGWTARNFREAFCSIVKGPLDGAPVQAKVACPGQKQDTTTYPGKRSLGVPSLALEGTPLVSLSVLFYGLGFLVTAVFVALGAPFWFDLLGRVMKMRAAGEKPATEASKASPATTGGDVSPKPGMGDAPTPIGGGPFSDTFNDFEAILTDADKVELQTLLNVSPTARLDEATRRAFVVRAKELGVDLNGKDELSLLAYMAIVGRHPAALQNLGGGSLFGAKVGVLAPQLTQLLSFSLDQVRQPADRRALAMRYLLKQALAGQTDSPTLGELDALARSRAINRLDDWSESARRPIEALTEDDLAKVLKNGVPERFKRSQAPWLDWAFGELGQTEENKAAPEASNPRVVDYLRQAGDKTGGDSTPWCGAFAAWVVQQYNQEHPEAPLPEPPDAPTAAASWMAWGEKKTQAEARPGDAAVFYQDPANKKGHHVTWVVRKEGDGRLYVIGGNQGEGCVSLALRGGASDPVVQICRGTAGGAVPAAAPPDTVA